MLSNPIAIVFGLICFVFLAHMTAGLRESLTVRPSLAVFETQNSVSYEKVERNWVQLMCAFQLVSVDLLAVAVVLYLLAYTDYLHPAPKIALGMSALFAFWGISWLVQLATLKRPRRDYLLLGHWSFWFLCSGLLFWGSFSV